MTGRQQVAVIGATGFIGSAVAIHLRAHDHDVVAVRAPRLTVEAGTADALIRSAEDRYEAVADRLMGCSVVINAAGIAVATSSNGPALWGANTLLPLVLQKAALAAGAQRFVQISSSAVQGRTARLTEDLEFAPDSAYSRSKAAAEQLLMAHPWDGSVILRPTSVHGPGRAITRRIASLARSPFSMVAAPGSRPTPQVHVAQVARAVQVLTDLSLHPPQVVLQPWEGFTTSSFLETLAPGRRPRQLPACVVTGALKGGFAASRLGPSRLWANARRAELLLRGQPQVQGWLARTDPSLCEQHPSWAGLAAELLDTTEGDHPDVRH